MSGTRGVDAGVQGPARPDTSEVDEALAADEPRAGEPSDAEWGIRLVTQLAIEPYAAPVGGRTPTVIGYDDDLTDRGPGSVFEKLALRLGDDATATNEQRVAAQLPVFLSRTDREEVVEQAERLLFLSPERAGEFADLCADLAATGAQMEVIRGVRDDLEALGGKVDELLADPQAREEFLVRLANADPETARAWLAELGMGRAQAEALLVDLTGARSPDSASCSDLQTPMMGLHGEMLPRPASWNTGACGAPRAVSPEADAAFVAHLEQVGDWLELADSALDSAGIATSPVNVFRDYAPATDALLQFVAPGIDPASSLLAEGIDRAIENQDSNAAAARVFQVAVKLFTALATGPFYGLFGAALAAGSVVGEGANHDRMAQQQALGLSDERSTEFSSWGDAAAQEGIGLALAAGGGLATEAAVLGQAGVSTGSLTLDLGARAAGRFLGAVAGDSAAQFYEELAEQR
ncbi:MAG: hypothetical protein HY905_19235 [Deltaproteobacteria bacterium]|nr:hypothetical protein [Deltaproteobacteria bacterium]